jgi:membrane protein DedA with SNARE-associated domain
MAFIEISQLIIQYRYGVMVPGALIFGPAASVVAGFLVRLGYVEIIPTALCLAAGELIGDVVWYWLGKRWGETFALRYGRYVGISASSLASVKIMYSRYHDLILFISKITSGFGFAPAVLITAGIAGIPFRRYMMFNIVGQVFFTAALLALGYFFGHLYLQVTGILEKMLIFALGVVVLALLVGFGRYLRSRLTEQSA